MIKLDTSKVFTVEGTEDDDDYDAGTSYYEGVIYINDIPVTVNHDDRDGTSVGVFGQAAIEELKAQVGYAGDDDAFYDKLTGLDDQVARTPGKVMYISPDYFD